MVDLVFKDANTVRIFGSVDLFCVEQIKHAINQRNHNENLTLDMREVNYIDSAGLGMLIYFHKECAAKGASVRILPSDAVRRILVTSDLAALFLTEQDGATHKNAETEENVIRFYDCLESDTRLLSSLIERLISDLDLAGYSKEEANEIVVAFDEAVTNAMFETIRETRDIVDLFLVAKKETPPKIVALTWKITPDNFTATVVDHGSGLDIRSEKENVPQTQAKDYLEQVSEHQDKSNLHITINGENVELKRLGMGLKIMTSLMDDVEITLIEPHEGNAESTDESHAMGTILTLHRARRLPRVRA